MNDFDFEAIGMLIRSLAAIKSGTPLSAVTDSTELHQSFPINLFGETIITLNFLELLTVCLISEKHTNIIMESEAVLEMNQISTVGGMIGFLKQHTSVSHGTLRIQ
jgi:hypothetical protein